MRQIYLNKQKQSVEKRALHQGNQKHQQSLNCFKKLV